MSVTESDTSTGGGYWDGKDQGLCFCGASADEHERAFMHFYLFGDKPDPIFTEGATSLDDIEVSHYYLLLEYLSSSDFVYEGHQRYFEKELARERERRASFRNSARNPFESLEQEWQEQYASCIPRSKSQVRFSGFLGRVLNGTHNHQFVRTMGGPFRCDRCGSRFSNVHDLGEEISAGSHSIRLKMERVTFPQRRIPRRIREHSFCLRCGSIPMPFWVSRGRKRFRAGVRGFKWCWAQVRKPVPWSLFMVLLGVILSNTDRVASWWPF